MNFGGTVSNFAYNPTGQLCKIGSTNCTAPNVTYDSAGRTWSLSGWIFEYDAEGRLVTACESSSSCSGSIDKVEFAYDGEGNRTSIKEYTAGSLTNTWDFRYKGDAIVAETKNGSAFREYVVDDQGTIIRFCDPDCATGTQYLVTWNGHGDALAVWRIKSDGTLEIANSYTYSSWGAPTIKSDHVNSATSQQYGDLGFHFLYVGSQGVQWDDFSGLGLHYMHARHYSPAIGRFLQSDPSAAELNHYAYAANNPITRIDPSGHRNIESPSPGGAQGGNGGSTDALRGLLGEAFWWVLPYGRVFKLLGASRWFGQTGRIGGAITRFTLKSLADTVARRLGAKAIQEGGKFKIVIPYAWGKRSLVIRIHPYSQWSGPYWRVSIGGMPAVTRSGSFNSINPRATHHDITDSSVDDIIETVRNTLMKAPGR